MYVLNYSSYYFSVESAEGRCYILNVIGRWVWFIALLPEIPVPLYACLCSFGDPFSRAHTFPLTPYSKPCAFIKLTDLKGNESLAE